MSSSSESLIQGLMSRGWCLRDTDQVKALIAIQSALDEDTLTLDSIESQLCNLDLRSLGANSLPDPSFLRKTSHLQGPKVLQISSVRDISRPSNSVADDSNDGRLLRLKLTDGHTEITGIEYSPIPSIPHDAVPGTKVRLVNKPVIRSGILCLNPKDVTVLGGVVESLYEEWQMNKKYSGFSRSSKPSQNDESVGPPPFEKLQIGAPSHRLAPQSRFSHKSESTSTCSGFPFVEKDGSSGSRQISRPQNKEDSMDNDGKSVSLVERTEGELPSTEARPKVAEAVPVQNQAASQKLLQKMSRPNWDRDNHNFRGRKHRGKGRDEDLPVLTLDEWERRKAGANPVMRNEPLNISQDEDLARQLQSQFDLEDRHVQRGPHLTKAEDIKTSMFNFERENARDDDRTGFRGRGRGGGRGRGRGRGRDRFS